MTDVQEQTQMTAVDMQPDTVYKTIDSDNQYYGKLIEKKEQSVILTVYYPNARKWKQVEVPNTYKVRPLNADEAPVAEELLKKSVKKPRAKKGEGVKRTAGPGALGKVSGLKMLAAYGKYIGENIDKEGGRELALQAMIADFPTKEESIKTWLDSYRGYYNTGRLPGTTKVERANFKNWIPTKEEREVAEAERAQKAEIAKAKAAAKKEAAEKEKPVEAPVGA